VNSTPRALRSALRGRRLAVVLSGGGALGAYEVGVLRVLEQLGVRPAILAGVSVGAINAVAWLAHDFRARSLERVWSSLRGSEIGLRWTSLTIRLLGGLVAAVGVVEAVLTLLSSQELSALQWFHRRVMVRSDVQAILLDVAAWVVVAAAGAALVFFSRPTDEWLASWSAKIEGSRAYRWLGRVLLVGVAIHVLTLFFGVPWPHRFSATALLVGGALWLFGRHGRSGEGARQWLMRMFPETRGRGLWGTEPRRRLIERLVGEGSAERLIGGQTHLIISACDLASGRVVHFVNWPNPEEKFRSSLERALGEVMPLHRSDDLLRAALASSALPILYEPVRVHGRDFVDAGPFSNQPIHVAIADDADQVLVVLLSPSAGPAPGAHDPNLLELGGRLIELASWREMQGELNALGPEWTRRPDPDGQPARVCVVEPARVLPGGVLGFAPEVASDLMSLGEADAWRALEQSGWLERS
jgi:predicted acylesterase/phospholipase RssA